MNNDYKNHSQSDQPPRQESQSYPVNPYQYSQADRSQQYPNRYNNPYTRPQYIPQPPLPQPGSGLATASMICGIFSLVFFCTGPFAIVGIILGIIAVITAACAKKKGFVGGMATAGLTTGIIGMILSALVFISCIACLSTFSSASKKAIAEEWPDIIEDWGYDYDWDYDYGWDDYI